MTTEESSNTTIDSAYDLRCGNIPFQKILLSMSNAVVVVDRDGTIVYVNPAYTRIMDFTAEQVLGRNMKDVTPDARTLKVLKTGKAIAYDSFFSEKLGLDLVLSSNPIFEDGELAGVVTVFFNSKDLMELYGAYRRAHGLVNYYQDLLLKEQIHAGSFASVIGASSSLSQVVAMARRVAETDATVLITGENGVGKDVLAQAIRRASGRRDKAFIAVNCAAIPDSLLESELFGFASGAFTGATRGGKLGKFELAEGGTIFLDEVGDMSSSMQSKLLRVLQEKEIEKVGGTQVTRVDVRVIAATNRDLEQMVRDGQFRQDLLYRLNMFPLHLPPLRERKEDIPTLALHFLEQFCDTYKRKLVIAPETFETLASSDWPGNIRQLRNTIERAVILCDADVLLPEHLGDTFACPAQPNQAPEQGGLKSEIRKVERKVYEDALSSSGGNKSLAMKKLGVSRRTFYKRLHELDLF
jgi:transcriptional regulator with PAS, ATPase and Fis domain